ncbi:MAG: isocitrate lyase/phosphoenolpyruvate mutase family protein [Alphaproteobacteria bacterium]|nr:isocitrate lyase/phosphoenolpyruvate mutase family protein [Alphaproteobacteria bacterium]MBL6671511.1 isocitrate lyase/phosphoenolpyruvate mutase family protein [Alphaproteobacteria bacterium]
MSRLADHLAARLADQAAPPVLAPGVFDGLSARMASMAGAEALYLSGASLAYTRFGSPDIGLVSMSELVDTVAAITEKTETPLIVDADTGFGNALNVQRTCRNLARAGAAAIQLEDQTLPKRCGHLSGKTLVSSAEMAGKISAARDALSGTNCLLVARTDAIAVEGLAAALDRAEAMVEAGADILFVEAPPDQAAMQQLTDRFAARIPLLANMVEGGRTPLLPLDQLGTLGYRLVIYPGAFVRAMTHLGTAFYADLLRDGSTASWQDRMLDLGGLNTLLGTDEILQAGARYDEDVFGK